MIPSKRSVFNIVAAHIYTQYIYVIFLVMLLLAACNTQQNKKITLVKGSVLSMALASPVPLSKAETQELHDGCSEWYEHALKASGFNGGMLVAKNGNIIFEAYNGNAHLNRKDGIDSLTSFHIASVSKTFTAMAVLKLWQDGKLNIDEELVKYFPSFNYPGVTIRTLLNHRSGLPNYVHFINKKNVFYFKIIKCHDNASHTFLYFTKSSMTKFFTFSSREISFNEASCSSIISCNISFKKILFSFNTSQTMFLSSERFT